MVWVDMTWYLTLATFCLWDDDICTRGPPSPSAWGELLCPWHACFSLRMLVCSFHFHPVPTCNYILTYGVLISSKDVKTKSNQHMVHTTWMCSPNASASSSQVAVVAPYIGGTNAQKKSLADPPQSETTITGNECDRWKRELGQAEQVAFPFCETIWEDIKKYEKDKGGMNICVAYSLLKLSDQWWPLCHASDRDAASDVEERAASHGSTEKNAKVETVDQIRVESTEQSTVDHGSSFEFWNRWKLFVDFLFYDQLYTYSHLIIMISCPSGKHKDK